MSAKQLTVKQNRQAKQRVMVIASGLFFLASTGFTMINLFSSAIKQTEANPANSTEPPVDSLAQQEQGYEMVLQREPENTIALEGLVNIRLQMNDTKGAIEPLESLVQLHPERSDYKTLLNQLKNK